ncbi:MAG: CdaR family protein [Acidobacteriota bacterium]
MKLNLLDNLPLKVLSIILAFLLWIYFTGEKQIYRDIEVPLNIDVAPEKVLSGELISSVTIRVRGSETAIARLAMRPLYSSIDLTDSPAGEKFIQISPKDNIRGIPPDLEVVSVTPERIKATVENRVSRQIMVVPKIMGKAKEPYVYYGFEAYPNSFSIEGAQSAVQSTEKVVTEVINIEGKSQSFRTIVDIMTENPSVRIVNPRPVTVLVKIDRDIKHAIFEDLPISFTSADYSFEPSHDIASLTVEGPGSIIEKINRSNISITIKLRGLNPSDNPYRLTPFIQFNSLSDDEMSKISVTLWHPRTVSVKINPGRVKE